MLEANKPSVQVQMRSPAAPRSATTLPWQSGAGTAYTLENIVPALCQVVKAAPEQQHASRLYECLLTHPVDGIFAHFKRFHLHSWVLIDPTANAKQLAQITASVRM